MWGREREIWEHVWEECRQWSKEGGSWQEAVGLVLGEEGEGEEWMREIEEERKREGRGKGSGRKHGGEGEERWSEWERMSV